MNVALIGAGRAGRALAGALLQGGCEIVAVAGGRSDAAKQFAARLGAAFYAEAAAAAAAAEVVVLAVPDKSIAAVAAQLAESDALPAGLVVLHICGSQSAESLACLRARGAAVGSMHPLQSFTEDTAAGIKSIKGIYFAVDGDEAAVKAAAAMIGLVGGRMLLVPSEKRAVYHAAACMASNYLVALLHGAVKLMQSCGIAEPESLQALQPIIAGTLQNIMSQGTGAALTGPIVRGDGVTLERQMAQLQVFAPEETALYRALGEYTIDMVQSRNVLTPQQVDELRRALRAEDCPQIPEMSVCNAQKAK